MFKRWLPRETSFFDFFEEHSRLCIKACNEMDRLAREPHDLAACSTRIKDIEHEADDITHRCIDALHRTFITPFDRGDIHRLIKRQDDIIDSIDAASSRMMLYDMTQPREELALFTRTLITASNGVNGAVAGLRNLKRGMAEIESNCEIIYTAENEGDQILRAALARLFREETAPVLVIKWKEIFERLEIATDRCEEVANIIQGIVIEAS